MPSMSDDGLDSPTTREADMIRNPQTVGDVMTATVVAVTSEAPFKEIVRTLEKWKVSAVPVLEDQERVVGVVSEADLLRKEERRDSRRPSEQEMAKADAVTAGALMTAPAVTVRADAPIAQAARAMARHRVKRLPVVDEKGRLKGMVSRGDLLKVFLRSDEDIAEDVRHVLAQYFPVAWETVEIGVSEGVVTLSGLLHDTSMVPVAARLVRTVEGVVDITFDITNGSMAPR
jgi:CBS domain-containing protein